MIEARNRASESVSQNAANDFGDLGVSCLDKTFKAIVATMTVNFVWGNLGGPSTGASAYEIRDGRRTQALLSLPCFADFGGELLQPQPIHLVERQRTEQIDSALDKQGNLPELF